MNSYLRSFLFAFLLFAVADATAQFGVRTKYNMNSFSKWDDYLDQNITGNIDKIFPSNVELGIDYWFRLKNYRIEFMPELAIGLKSTSNYPIVESSTSFSYFAFNFNTNIYLFDLEGDCDCPTFSKQGPSLNKGFFVSLSPGVLYNTTELNLSVSELTQSSNQVNLRLGIGVGFDIGLSDLFTITPMISYNLSPNVSFDQLEDIFSNGPVEIATPEATTFRQIQFQLRFGFRPDYVKSYGRGRR